MLLCRPCSPVVADGDVEGPVGLEDEEADLARVPEALRDVPEPSAEEIARHCLTHLPYKRWCRWCVAARMANRPHLRLPPFSRSVPPFVLDY